MCAEEEHSYRDLAYMFRGTEFTQIPYKTIIANCVLSYHPHRMQKYTNIKKHSWHDSTSTCDASPSPDIIAFACLCVCHIHTNICERTPICICGCVPPIKQRDYHLPSRKNTQLPEFLKSVIFSFQAHAQCSISGFALHIP